VFNEVLRAVLRLVIDYFRWTQLIPMLACWGLLLAVLFFITVTSLESEGVEAFETVVAVIFGLVALLPDAILPRGPDGSIEMSGSDFIDLAAWAWFVLSIIAMLVNWIAGDRLRPEFLKTLPGRLRTAAIAAAIVCLSLIVIRLLVPQNFNGPFVSWLPTFIGMPLIVWIVSAYSLCVSAILSLIDDLVVAQTSSR
jgi:hypothetical protein